MTDEDRAATPPPFAPPVGEPSAVEGPPAAAFEGTGAPRPRRPLNPLAVAALICGILGLAPAAVVLGHVGFAQAGRSGQRGRGFAVAGFVLGYLAIVVAVAGWFAYTAYVDGLRDGGYLPS